MKKVILTGIAAFALGALLYADDARTLFEKSCAACHGKDGKGDTKIGKKFELRDYTDPKVQEALKDEEMIKAIKEGIKDGEKTKMKGFGDRLTDEEIKALVAYIRNFKKS